MLKLVHGLVLGGATISLGLMAGVFGLYSHTLMPGLGSTDDRTFVGAFQAIDRAILNPLFVPVFVGGLFLTGAATGLSLTDGMRSLLPWLAIALVLYLVAFAITGIVNVPLNDAIKAAGDPDTIADLAEVRRQFDEPRWTAFNHVRTGATTIAFFLLVGSLVQFGRLLD